MLFLLFATTLVLLNAALLTTLWWQGKKQAGEIAALKEDLRREIREEGQDQFDRLMLMHALRDRLDLNKGLPWTPKWSASPDFLALIVEHVLTEKPRLIVECGSGLTTLMLARCCALNGEGRVISLENGAEFAAKTRAEIARYGLADRATVLDAPLTSWALPKERFQWYSLDELPADPIDMLVVDGPPGFIQRHSRYPALPLLADRLADGCMVFLDDAARPEEREVVALWLAEFPYSQHRYLDTERGCSVLRIRRRPAESKS